jgi:acyl carrier protein
VHAIGFVAGVTERNSAKLTCFNAWQLTNHSAPDVVDIGMAQLDWVRIDDLKVSMDPGDGQFTASSGFDSLSAVELSATLSRTLRLELPALVAFDYPSVDALAGYVSTLVAAPDSPSAAFIAGSAALAGHQATADDNQGFQVHD